jgi:hypothetical protein
MTHFLESVNDQMPGAALAAELLHVWFGGDD